MNLPFLHRSKALWVPAAIACLGCCHLMHGGLPRPSVVFCGLATDEYGWPYYTNASVTLWINSKPFKTQTIAGMPAPDMNFAIRVPLDSGSGAPYDARVARSRDTVAITLSVDGEQKTLMAPSSFPPVGQPGEIIRVNVTVGTDSDGNGIPDEWQQWIVDQAHNPNIKTIEDVKPGDDADGDGVSNIDEYRAGTDPANAADTFIIENAQAAENGRLSIRFLSVPGKTYKLWSSPAATAAGFKWAPCAVASSPTADFRPLPITGTGRYMTVFVEAGEANRMFRVGIGK